MGAFDNATEIICTSCGTKWLKNDANTGHYFRSASNAIGSAASPKIIADAAEDMTFCPSDNVAQLEAASIALESGQFALDKRIDPDGLDKERASSGGADVIHDATRATRK